MVAGTGKYFICGMLGAILAAGCVRQDLGECPEDTGYSLWFYYPANDTADEFSRYIDHVDLYIYNTDGTPVLEVDLSRAGLDTYQGVVPELDAGYYTVVSWGNADGYSVVSGTDDLDTGRIYQSQYAAGGTVTDFDSLYFARWTVFVDPAAGGRDTVEFVSAHINMEVHIAGYGEVPAGSAPLELTGVPVGYDFAMNLLPEQADMFPRWSLEGDEGIITTRFRLLRFPEDTGITLRIPDADGGIRAEIGLADFLARNGIDVEGVNEITVPVYILFRGPDFYVTVDGWETMPVFPTVTGS